MNQCDPGLRFLDHEAVVGDYVTLAGATDTDGIPAAEINQEHRIIGIPDGNTIELVMPTTAATAGSVSGGGSSMTATFQINVGLDTFVSGSGWGAGSWGSSTWGGSTDLDPASQLRLWSQDNFGDDLIGCVRTGGIYYWDESDGLSVRAKAFSDLTRRTVTLPADPLQTQSAASPTVIVYDVNHGAGVGDKVTISGATGFDGLAAGDINGERTVVSVLTDSSYTITADANASAGAVFGGGSAVQTVYTAGVYYTPTKALQIMTSPTARHIIAFGCNAAGETTIQSLLIRWCSSEFPAQWRPTDQNTAGDFPISTGSAFIGALRTRQEIIIWTDVGMVSMRYVGRRTAHPLRRPGLCLF